MAGAMSAFLEYGDDKVIEIMEYYITWYICLIYYILNNWKILYSLTLMEFNNFG
jgi:hypothetical protein